MHTLAIIEDNAAIRNVLAGFFASQEGYELVLVAVSYEDFVARWKGASLDVVLCDIGLPGKLGTDAAWYIKQHSPQTEVVMLTVFEDNDHVFSALCSGATGYLLKHTPLDGIRRSLDEIMTGGAAMSPQIARQVMGFFSANSKADTGSTQLTPREIEVTARIQEGRSNQEIADMLFISVSAVKFHVKNIYLKLQVSNRGELMRRYRKR